MKKIFYTTIQKWQETNLMLRILCGIILGSILALVCPQWSGIGILGTLFVGALKAIAPVLVAVLVTSSVAKAREGLGDRFRTVISLYVISTLLAAVLAVVISYLCPVSMVLSGVAAAGEAVPNELSEIFQNIARDLMSNPLTAISNALYLSILFWSIIIGLAIKKLASSNTIDILHDWAEAISQVVRWIIQCAPLGILGLVFTTVSENGMEIFTVYGQLLLILVGCMLTVSLVINPLIVTLLLKQNPYPLVWQCIKESAISAFFTRSSAANIPVNMALCRKLGLDKNFYSVSIPLGSTINMNGAAITITVMTLATCHTLGIEVPLISSLILSAIATLGACGASGVAGGSLLLIPMACALFGINNDVAMQVVAVGFIIGVVQDSVETALNSSGDVLFTATAEFYERKKQNKSISQTNS
ncbi:MAG: serine/threonine transporter SstT [Mediterranea massiliensis]|nr:serine/threonine transporter SstT [Mediterranea massiliensis]